MRLAGYTVLQTLGEGSTATVYAALHKRTGRVVALKMLKPELRADAHARMRFHREAKALWEISHRNVIQVTDYSGPAAAQLFIACEKLEGLDLERAVVHFGAVPEGVAKAMFAQVARGLAAAHARGLVHRDLSLRNIFIERSGRVVVADFGLVAAVVGARTRETFASRAASVVGSPLYLAPEVLQAQHYDARTDLYALGVSLSFALLGRPPGVVSNLEQLLLQIVDGKLELPRHVSPQMRALLTQLTGPRAQRPTDAGFVASELEEERGATWVSEWASEGERARKSSSARTLKLRF